jgi:hypothetical protein
VDIRTSKPATSKGIREHSIVVEGRKKRRKVSAVGQSTKAVLEMQARNNARVRIGRAGSSRPNATSSAIVAGSNRGNRRPRQDAKKEAQDDKNPVDKKQAASAMARSTAQKHRMKKEAQLKAVRMRLRQEAQADSVKVMKKVELEQRERKDDSTRDNAFAAVNDLAEALAEGLKDEYKERMVEKKRSARRRRDQEAEINAKQEEEKEQEREQEREQAQALLLIDEQERVTKELKEADARMQKIKERRAAASGWSGTNDSSMQRVTSSTFNSIKAPTVKQSSSSLFKWDSGSLFGPLVPSGKEMVRPGGTVASGGKENSAQAAARERLGAVAESSTEAW